MFCFRLLKSAAEISGDGAKPGPSGVGSEGRNAGPLQGPPSAVSFLHHNLDRMDRSGAAPETKTDNSKREYRYFIVFFQMTILGLLPLLVDSSYTVSKIPVCRLRL